MCLSLSFFPFRLGVNGFDEGDDISTEHVSSAYGDMIQIPLTRFEVKAIDGDNKEIEHYRCQMWLHTRLNENG